MPSPRRSTADAPEVTWYIPEPDILHFGCRSFVPHRPWMAATPGEIPFHAPESGDVRESDRDRNFPADGRCPACKGHIGLRRDPETREWSVRRASDDRRAYCPWCSSMSPLNEEHAAYQRCASRADGAADADREKAEDAVGEHDEWWLTERRFAAAESRLRDAADDLMLAVVARNAVAYRRASAEVRAAHADLADKAERAKSRLDAAEKALESLERSRAARPPKPPGPISESLRRRIWTGSHSGFRGRIDPASLKAASLAKVGRDFLRDIGQEPDWSLVLDRHGAVMGRHVGGGAVASAGDDSVILGYIGDDGAYRPL